MAVMGVTKFERFFRSAAGLTVDRNDLKRYDDFVGRALFDLLVVAQAAATANARDIIRPSDLPITAGLTKCIHQFRNIEEGEIQLRPLLDQLAARRPADMVLSEEAEERLPEVVGGVSVALARSFRLIDPDLVNPSAAHWERAFHLFDLLL